ncbi:MAG TPA: sugar phosphate isomerase/epimerase [Chitinophagaceae bacterium]|nr:sugar phosphate isomerase/epimerase [Chitinophagaceae bacterium]
MKENRYSRRCFLKTSGALSGAFMLGGLFYQDCFAEHNKAKVPVDAHLWVYASRYPPNWDCTPILDEVFSDIKYAGYDKVELMEPLLKHQDAVDRINSLVKKYDLPITGTSYYGDMWDKDKQQYILEDIEPVIQKLHAVGGQMIGLTVGDAKRMKTEDELNTQAETLKKIITICEQNSVQPNLHNHTFEVINEMHDLKGTLKRIPGIKLGPDLNWLVRGGVDPVWFIKTYGHQMVYMHIRDQKANGKWTEAVGEGVIDFPAIAKALKDINYSGRAAVELAFDDPPVRPVKEDWKLSREYVRKVFGW